ncbi:hypothetical protein AGLY_010320 [Aphis glycines]|uniref:Uncharacterized protein n=1 Tax=Aphis glycines TaxID=307491 RepID=A0A6G0TGI8_APHGL|nr:hypothetical protein AGLY_010320 [Aphis glycines]
MRCCVLNSINSSIKLFLYKQMKIDHDLQSNTKDTSILDSERSDECIDFTMITTSRNNASISNFGGGFRWKSEYPWCIIQVKIFKKNREKQKKNDGKTGIFTQNQFSAESIFLYGCNSKTNHCKNLKFSPNVYFKFLRNLSKMRKFAIFLQVSIEKTRSIIIRKILSAVDKIFLALLKYLKILYKVPHMHNFFLLVFEVQILTKIRQNYEYLQIILPLKHKPPFSPTTENYILG